MKKIITGLAGLVLTAAIFTSCRSEDPVTPEKTPAVFTYEKESISYVTEENVIKNKYTDFTTSAVKQKEYKTINCHDPKLFQDDDGTYYVYSTDAAAGGSEKTGLSIRSSKDLVNWTMHTQSAIYGFWDKDFLVWHGMSGVKTPVMQSKKIGSFSASTWAPTVYKQNGLYYMLHGICTDSVDAAKKVVSSIVMAVASNATGPFYPVTEVSSFNRETETRDNYLALADDIESIQAKFTELGVTYTNSFLVRYIRYNTGKPLYKSTIDGEEIPAPDYTTCNNNAYGCIDPEFVFDVATGNIMKYNIGGNECYAVTYGSWCNGIMLVYVDAVTFKPVTSDGAEKDLPFDHKDVNQTGDLIAKGNGYEGAQLIYNSTTDRYYLFVSMGNLDYEYRVGVGRSVKASHSGTSVNASRIPTGYTDANGQNMGKAGSAYHSIGAKIIGATELWEEYSWRCPGGQSILRTADGKIMFTCHSRSNFAEGYYFWLQCREMFFNADEWPLLNQNEFNNDEEVSLTMADIAGTYDTILTVRGTESAKVSIYGESAVNANKLDGTPTQSIVLTIAEDGTLGGNFYEGSVVLDSDGKSAVITLSDKGGNTYGTFKGYFMKATDWALKGVEDSKRSVITFTTLCESTTETDLGKGEYFWGNKRNVYTTKTVNKNEALPPVPPKTWTTSADGNSVTLEGSTLNGTALNITNPKLDVNTTDGFYVEFTINAPSGTNDWTSKVISYLNYHVTLPNLDPWNNTDATDTTLDKKNAFPKWNNDGTGKFEGDYATMESNPYGSACCGKDVVVKITMKADEGIKYYLGGNAFVTYGPDVWDGAIATFMTRFAEGITAGNCVINSAALDVKDVTVGKMISE